MNEAVNVQEEKKEELILTEPTKGNILDVAPGCLSIELPSGYIERREDGDVNHHYAIVKEMTGYDEEILAAKGPIVPKLNAIVTNCMLRLGDIEDKATISRAVKEFTAQDRMAVLIAIRRVSLGDFYDCQVTCPECKVGQQQTVNLSEVKIVAMSDRMTRQFSEVLPSGTEIDWHVLNAEDEEWLSEMKKKREDVLTLGLMARVDRVGSEKLDKKKGYKKALGVLKGLGTRDRVALRALFKEREGDVDTSVTFVCGRCDHEWESNMPVDQIGFFFPSVQ